MLSRLQMRRDGRGTIELNSVALVIVYGQRDDVIARLARQACNNHRIEATGQQNDGRFGFWGHCEMSLYSERRKVVHPERFERPALRFVV